MQYLNVNEVAPRAHNSGHLHHRNRPITDQFEQHIRAILDLPSIREHSELIVAGVMVNLVGAESYKPDKYTTTT